MQEGNEISFCTHEALLRAVKLFPRDIFDETFSLDKYNTKKFLLMKFFPLNFLSSHF